MGGVDKDLALRMAFGGASSSGVESTAITAILQNAIQGAPYTHTHAHSLLFIRTQANTQPTHITKHDGSNYSFLEKCPKDTLSFE